jgi:hypothetical protein
MEMPFLRPEPVIESSEQEDEDEPIWLVPGFVPEPYWDLYMGEDISKGKQSNNNCKS